MKSKILLIIIIVLYGCNENDTLIEQNDIKAKSEFYQIDSCATFDIDTLNASVSFDRDKILTKWKIEKYYNLATCKVLIQDKNAAIFKEVTLTFYEGDSIIANCVNLFKGRYNVPEDGSIAVLSWVKTKEYETPWGQTFDTIFPKTKNYYIQDSLLMIFTDKYKIKLIKAP